MNKLGVDIGGVIIDRLNDNEDTSLFGDNFLEATPVPDAFDSLAELNHSEQFEGRLWLVSKCGQRIQERTRLWLEHNDFYDQTGISRENVHFTPTREGKVPIARSLQLTHFVDDRLEILRYVSECVENLYLFNPEHSEVQAHQIPGRQIQQFGSWAVLKAELLVPAGL